MKKTKLIQDIYRNARKRYRHYGKFKFINRSEHYDSLCMVLAGYKPTLWDNVFNRLARFVPRDVDVCVISSGKNSPDLEKICEINGWSYLETKRNNLSLAQNIAVDQFSSAKFIYKMDEDIFVTESLFENLLAGLKFSERESQFNPGFVAPVINVNNFSYKSILEKFNVQNSFQTKLNLAHPLRRGRYTFNTDPDAAEFMWGVGGQLPRIDEIALSLRESPIQDEVCPIRFNIGFILFRRELIEKFHFFPLGLGNALGLDEQWIDEYCLNEDCPPIVIGNAFAGHLGFGGAQSKRMQKVYSTYPDLFELPSNLLK